MSRFENPYEFSEIDKVGCGKTPTGESFVFDIEDYEKIKHMTWYRCNQSKGDVTYIGNHRGICIHRYIVDAPKGMEIDHINLNPMDNRKKNLRICTHQQNQCNQPLQKNNTSGITGVSYYKPRGKYRARIKVGQRNIHLGYYKLLDEAIQARNIGTACMFGEYGRYDANIKTFKWVEEKVIKICKRFVDLSICKAFTDLAKEVELDET